MQDTPHLLIPYAASRSPGGRAALRDVRLPNLERLLARLTPAAVDRDDPQELHPLSMPHERALAQALGLTDQGGRTPWAAYHVLQAGEAPGTDAWAWFSPCHWQVGMDSVTMDSPESLQLTDEESRALLAAVAPLAAEDGIVLEQDTPGRWLAHGEPLRDLATASLERVIGQDVRPWLPTGPGARLLQRLHSEMQMQLYPHPVNEARTAQRRPPVNALWIRGAGALEPGATIKPAPLVPAGLHTAALHDDWAAWREAWAQIDETEIMLMIGALDMGGHVTLTLCSEHSAQRFESLPLSFGERLSRLWPQRRVPAVLEAL